MSDRERGSAHLARGAAACAIVAGLLLAAAAVAHGPSVDVSFSAFRPRELVIGAGDTVHFRNAGGSGLRFTIVSDQGLFESPPLGHGRGWHHTFETPGIFSFHLKENEATQGRILVGEARTPEAEDPHAGHDH